MTSHSTRSLASFLALWPVAACYAPHGAVVSEADSGDESGATTASVGDPTMTPDTSGSATNATSATTDGDPTATGEASTGGSTTDAGSICGDGIVQGDEVCDDGTNDGAYDGCLPDCSDLGPHCGDGVEQGDEVCDDGDEIDGNGCNADCVVSGSELWTVVFDGTAHASDYVRGVAVGPDDTIGVAAIEGVASGAQASILRLSSEGDEDWNATYLGATGSDTRAHAVAIDGSGGIYVGGRYDGLAEAGNAWARKYDDTSALEYTHLFNGGSDELDAINGVAVSDDGYAVVVGRETRSDLNQGANIWVRRLGQDGAEFWTRVEATSATESANAVAVQADGSIVVVGTANSDLWIRKYDQDGGTMWTRTYDSGGSDYGYGVAIDEEGQIAVVGTSASGNNADAWIRQYDAAGAVTWTDSYDSGNDAISLTDGANAVAIDGDANIIVVGTSVSDDTLSEYAWVRKYTSDAQQLWTQEWHVGVPVTSAYTFAAAVAVDSTNHVIVGGSEYLDDQSLESDGWVRKLAP